MLALIYWNINKNNAKKMYDAIVDLSHAVLSKADTSHATPDLIFCITEPGELDESKLLDKLKNKTGLMWWSRYSPTKKYLVFGNVDENSVEFPITEIGNAFPCFVSRGSLSQLASYHLWFVHLASPVHQWHPDLLNEQEAMFLRQDILTQELDKKPDGILAMGDFNMEPFSKSMIGTINLNATPCRRVALNDGPVQVRPDLSIPYFFNPMWQLLGSWSSDQQIGTFYRNEKTVSSIRWHIIDHVLVRPSLIKLIQPGSPSILTTTGNTSLVTQTGAISSMSDHLPIATTLDI
jgi:hypothetical protein